ncbi:MAG: hypothetical protein WEC75_05030 [Dehalococcoidia bacterium]
MTTDVRGERGLTDGQRRAIEEAMRVLLEEDRDRGVDRGATFACPACSAPQGLLGSVVYGDLRLCNRCATRYEMARIGGDVRSCPEFISGRARAFRPPELD